MPNKLNTPQASQSPSGGIVNCGDGGIYIIVCGIVNCGDCILGDIWPTWSLVKSLHDCTKRLSVPLL